MIPVGVGLLDPWLQVFIHKAILNQVQSFQWGNLL